MAKTKFIAKKSRRTKQPIKLVEKLPLRGADMKIPNLNHKEGHGYRTKTPARIGKTFHNIGGHIVNPPIKCPFRKTCHDVKNELLCHVVDIGCCISCCDIKCDFYKWWDQASTRQRASWSLKNGIINPSMTPKRVR